MLAINQLIVSFLAFAGYIAAASMPVPRQTEDLPSVYRLVISCGPKCPIDGRTMQQDGSRQGVFDAEEFPNPQATHSWTRFEQNKSPDGHESLSTYPPGIVAMVIGLRSAESGGLYEFQTIANPEGLGAQGDNVYWDRFRVDDGKLVNDVEGKSGQWKAFPARELEPSPSANATFTPYKLVWDDGTAFVTQDYYNVELIIMNGQRCVLRELCRGLGN